MEAEHRVQESCNVPPPPPSIKVSILAQVHLYGEEDCI